jgi:RHS repeat-associated protein
MRHQWILKCLIAALLGSIPFFLFWGPESPPQPAPPEPNPVPGLPVVLDPAKNLTWRFERDKAGRISRVTDPAGRVTSIVHEYDKVGRQRRVVKKAADGSEVAFTFDHNGLRLSRTDSTGELRYQYGEGDLLTHVGRQAEPGVRYEYDSHKHLKSITLGPGLTVAYRYDLLGRLAEIATPAGPITYQHRTAQGRIVRRLPNGVETIWEFHPSGRLETLTHVDPERKLLSRASYSYRPDGLLKAIQEWTRQGERVRRLDYDLAMRLTRVEDSRLGLFTYRYDKLGNRIEERVGGQTCASTYDWASRLLTRGGKECAHDAVGNLTRYPGPEGERKFEYTVQSWLTKALVNNQTIGYQHDGEGNPVAREASAGRTTFVSDPVSEHWRPLLATDPAGKKTLFVWDGSTPLAAFQEGKAQFFLHDHQGSVTARLDSTGKLVEQVQFAPFGQPVGLAGDGLQPGFKGLFFDPETNLYLDRQRAYDPTLGRFLQREPGRSQPQAEPRAESPYSLPGADPANPEPDDSTAQPLPGAQPPPAPPADRLRDVLRDLDGSSQLEEAGSTTDSANPAGKQGANPQGNPAAGNPAPGLVYNPPAGIPVPGLPGNPMDKLDPDSQKELDDFKQKNEGIIQRLERLQRDQPQSASPPSPVDDAVARAMRPLNQGLDQLGRLTLSPQDDPQVSYSWRRRQSDLRRWMQRGTTTRPTDLGAFLRGTSNPSTPTPQFTPPPAPDLLQTVRDMSGVFKRPQAPGTGTSPKSGPATSGPSGVVVPGSGQGTPRPGYNRGSSFNDQLPELRKARDDAQKAWQELQRLDPSFAAGIARGQGKSPTTPTTVSGGTAPSSSPPGGRPAQKVGGVALRGAGKALASLGALDGIALDANGGLVLIGRKQGEIGLPPLRLDDVVTVFRCVYLHGDSPSVSIDPIPGDPKGPRMNVRHGKGTANTYVGWVLFEADRIMKTYGQGKDNITHQPIRSGVPGFDRLFDLRFASEAGPQRWHRYWFVPARTTRLQARDGQLTLLHVPLQVRCETEVMRNGTLQPAPDVPPSAYAKAFSRWFTENYEALAREIYSMPPPETGITSKVAVLKELQRVALIAAIAESLRDQGVPMPAWMNNYPVRPCPVPETTPTLTVKLERKSGRTTRWVQLFGGVTLSAPSDTIVTRAGDRQADSAAPALHRVLAGRPLFTPVTFTSEGQQFQAIALPGNETRALGGLGLAEDDLEVPLAGDETIRLTRHFHSFYVPEGALGRGWTLDLPQLQKQRLVTRRTEKSSSSRSVYELVSPLGTWNESFRDYKQVPEFKASILVPRSSLELIGLIPLREGGAALYFRDGRRWFFDDDGRLVRMVKGPLTMHYRWVDERVTAIEGWLGGVKKADIRLEHDAQGRVVSANGSSGARVRYLYNADQQLRKVQRSGQVYEYGYQGGLVHRISHNGRVVRLLDFNKDGQLVRERDGSGREHSFTFRGDATGYRVTVAGRTGKDVVEYDPSFRPVHRRLADGTKIDWRYGDKGSAQMLVNDADGTRWELTRGSDGRMETVRTAAKGGTVRVQKDAAGRVTGVQQDGRTVLSQQYRSDGLLQAVVTESAELFPSYAADGTLKSIFLGGEKAAGNKYSSWMRLQCDEQGRPVALMDQWGLKVQFEYDKEGRLTGLSSGRGHVQAQRRENTETVETSWGMRQVTRFSKDGVPERAEIEADGRKGLLEFKGGQPTRIKLLGGGEVRIAYQADGPNRGRPSELRTADDLVVRYQYNPTRRFTGATYGNTFRRVYTYDAQGRITGSTEVPAQ